VTFKTVSGLGWSFVVLAVILLLPDATPAGASSGSCPNEASPGFRTYLPDCRAYELVTPPYKEGMAASGGGALSQDGSSLIIQGFGSFAGVDTAPIGGAVYAVSRTPTGWLTTPMEAPLIATYPRFEESAASVDLTSSLWDPTFPDQAAESVFLREEDGALVGVGPSGPPGAVEPRLTFAGASSDLSHLVFYDVAPLGVDREGRLWPGDATQGEAQLSLYEYVGTANNEPQLVGISNKGVVDSIGEAHLISQCGTELGSPEGDVYNAISQNGSMIFFTALGQDSKPACQALSLGVEPAASGLYARVENGLSSARTVAISEPSPEECSECDISSPADAQFQGASRDGSKAFFTTEQHLLPDAIGTGPFLYEYNFDRPEGRKVTLVSAGDATGARVQGVARVSEDGSHAYFVAQGKLTGEEANTYGERAKEGAENLYVSVQECSGGGTSCPEPQQRLSFIGRLSEADHGDWAGSDLRPVQVTSDGRFLAFESSADLTPDDTSTVSQVFEYDSQTKTLVRVSHGAGGYNEDGNSDVYPATIPSPGYSRIDHPESRFTAISASGSYVFFVSADGLSPSAVVGHLSVYEYHAGVVSLISDGHDLSEAGSTLIGADESGEDVFFTTADPLVPQDVDTQEDIYDARVDGGFAAPPTNQGCVEDACQGSLAGGLQSPTPATSSSEGEGEVPAASSLPAKVTTAPRPAKAKTKKQTKKKVRRKRVHKAKHAAKARKRS
jgi:hypothetical protein